jgi:hypothetical protein
MFSELILAYNQVLAGTVNPIIGAWEIFYWIFFHGGWLVFLYLLFQFGWYHWDLYVLTKHDSKRNWILLAIDVPKDNIQTPKAVENIFATLAGAHSSTKILKRYFLGDHGDWFCFEIVGIEGYVQFIIRTTDTYRDLVESAIYGQYPDAEITEVADYTEGYPTEFPNDKYQIYGTEFVYVDDEALPIRTYPEFEDAASKEFKDPLQGILEVMNKLGPGEQIWFQMLIDPIGPEWKKNSEAFIDKVMGKNNKKGPGLFDNLTNELKLIYQSAQDQATGGAGLIEAGELGAKDATSSSLLLLPPHKRAKVEAAADKMKKIAYSVKLRLVYIARKENWKPVHGREAFIGAIKQFNTEDLNALRPDTKSVGVHAQYIFTEWRKNRKRTKLMARYKGRSVGYGRPPQVMNIEELATIWHFPVKTEFQPIRHMVQRTQTKSNPPPTTVPFASLVEDEVEPPSSSKGSETNIKQGGPPPNLPVA